MARIEIPVHRWGPRRISGLFRRRTETKFSFVSGAGYLTKIQVLCDFSYRGSVRNALTRARLN